MAFRVFKIWMALNLLCIRLVLDISHRRLSAILFSLRLTLYPISLAFVKASRTWRLIQRLDSLELFHQPLTTNHFPSLCSKNASSLRLVFRHHDGFVAFALRVAASDSIVREIGSRVIRLVGACAGTRLADHVVHCSPVDSWTESWWVMVLIKQ